MKGYLPVPEISYKWNVSERWASKLTQDGRIPGVIILNCAAATIPRQGDAG